jgi:hypothetical protein
MAAAPKAWFGLYLAHLPFGVSRVSRRFRLGNDWLSKAESAHARAVNLPLTPEISLDCKAV